MIIRKTKMIGNVVRARKIAGGKWLVYHLSNPERADYVGNRVYIDTIYGRKHTYKYVKDLDPDEVNEDEQLSES